MFFGCSGFLIFQAFILGIVQGLTEFLPVSSSGHLVLVPYWLGWQIPAEQAFVFDVLVQVGTLVAVFAFFWDDVMKLTRAAFTGLVRREPFADPDARMAWYIVLATIPAGLVGLGIKDWVEAGSFVEGFQWVRCAGDGLFSSDRDFPWRVSFGEYDCGGDDP